MMSLSHDENLVSIWFNVIWLILALFISPALFLLTKILTEVPVLIVRRANRILRLKIATSNELRIQMRDTKSDQLLEWGNRRQVLD